MIKKLVLLALSCSALSVGCAPESRTAAGVIASEEPRIWVVREVHSGSQVIGEVYRCADGAPADQPPKPVCVKAPMGE